MFSGGLRLDIDYTPALLYQVAKMDGAIVLNAQATQIVAANVQLMPDPTILSTETGTRHRTAERVSKQAEALVVAISERREVVSLYLGGMKYILQDIPAVLAKANQGLATLDKYRARLDSVSSRPDPARVRGRLGALRRPLGAPARRAGDPHGRRGRALHRRARHRGPPDRDAARGDDGRRRRRQGRADPRLLGRGHRGEPRHHHSPRSQGFPTRTCSTSGGSQSCSATSARSPHSTSRSPRAATACSGRIPRLPKLVVQRIIHEFGGLEEVLAASDEDLEAVEGVGATRAKDIREGVRRLQEIDPVDRYLQSLTAESPAVANKGETNSAS